MVRDHRTPPAPPSVASSVPAAAGAGSPPASEKPTRVRYIVLAFAAALSMITYLDRVCISSAQSSLIEDLGLQSEADLKWVFWAFALAYSLFEMPTGWLGDVYGPKRVLIRIVLWWSAFTAITGMIGMHVGGYVIGSLTVLVIVRFLFGMGEAGAYPNITRALHNWFPFHERGFAQGTVWMSARLMGGLTPAVWMVLVHGVSVLGTPPLLHWRETFWLFGVLGVVWCVLFAWWFKDRPEAKRSVNQAELALIRTSAAETQSGHRHVPWGRLLTNTNLWILGVMYFCQAYGWYFYITYLPRFLETQYGVKPDSLEGSIYKGGPLWMGAIGCLLGGFLTDWYIRRTGNRRMGRKLFGVFGHAMCVVCFLLCPLAPTAFWFFLAISLAGFFADITMGSSWAVCQDIGRRHAAIVAGFMNMVGNFGGSVAILVTGFVLDASLAWHSQHLAIPIGAMSEVQKADGLLTGYHVNFVIYAAVFVVGTICWTLIDATKPVMPDEPAAAI